MAKSNKQTGYLVKIEAFVPADISDMDMLSKVQDARMQAMRLVSDIGGTIDPLVQSITPTRR